MSRLILFLSLLLGSAAVLLGQTPATTSDGHTVNLHGDGTWNYAEPGRCQATLRTLRHRLSVAMLHHFFTVDSDIESHWTRRRSGITSWETRLRTLFGRSLEITRMEPTECYASQTSTSFASALRSSP